MSVNRENVTWPAEDGTWNIGFWDYYDVGRDDEDWDYEWGVEYVHDRFWCASWGNATPEAAYDRYTAHYANPGGGWVITDRNDPQVKHLDEVLAAFRKG